MIIFQSEDQFSSSTPKHNPDVIIYDNSNIQKSCSGVTTPLTFNFTKRVYSEVFEQTLKSLSLSDRGLLKNEAVFQNLIGLVKGRIFYNINNWYQGLQYFCSTNENKRNLSQIMGLSEPVYFADDKAKGWWQRCVLLWSKFINIPRLLIAFGSLKSRIPNFLNDMQNVFTAFYDQKFENMRIRELKAQKKFLDSKLKLWTTPVLNDLYILIASGNVAERLSRAGLNNPAEFVNSFLSEEESLVSLQPAKHLHRLAIEASYHTELKYLINKLPSDIHWQVKIRFKGFYKEVVRFIDLYGDRTTGELKLETATIRQNPVIFYTYLKDCLNLQLSEIRSGDESSQKAFKAVEQKLSHLSLREKKRILSKVTRLQKAIAYREAFKLERSRVVGMYRTLYSAFGAAFEKYNWIENRGDIFYLTEDEILSCENGREYIFSTLIATRKQEYETYKAEDVPSRVIVATKVINAILNNTPSVPVIQGYDSNEIKAEVA